MLPIKQTTLLLSLLTLSSVAAAEDIAHGKTLHENNCLVCHSRIMDGKPNTIYTRENRRIKDYEGLFRQVVRCQQNLKLNWPQENIDDVVAYLNQAYYKFEL